MNVDAGSIADGQWTRYEDARRHFSLDHPAEWEIQRGVAGLLVAVAGPRREEGAFRPNLNVVRKSGIAVVELDELARAAIREVTRVLTDLTVLDIEPVVVSDVPARRVLFSYRQGIFGLTAEQWLFFAQEGQWTISAAASSEDYDDVADVFARMARSVQVFDG